MGDQSTSAQYVTLSGGLGVAAVLCFWHVRRCHDIDVEFGAFITDIESYQGPLDSLDRRPASVCF